MLSKRYESTEVDRRTWQYMPSGTFCSTSSDTYQVVEILKETSKLAFVLMLRPFIPELVISTDLLSFEHPSVLLFCFY